MPKVRMTLCFKSPVRYFTFTDGESVYSGTRGGAFRFSSIIAPLFIRQGHNFIYQLKEDDEGYMIL